MLYQRTHAVFSTDFGSVEKVEKKLSLKSYGGPRIFANSSKRYKASNSYSLS
jgi:hypothetical protein